MPGQQPPRFQGPQPQGPQFQGPPPPGYGPPAPKPPGSGARIGLVVLTVVIALASVPSPLITAVDRLTSPKRANEEQLIKLALGGFAALGVLALLVGALLVAIGVVAGRYVLFGAAAAFAVATALQVAFRSFDEGMLAWVAGAGIAAGLTFLPQVQPHFRAKRAPAPPPPGWGPPPPGWGTSGHR